MDGIKNEVTKFIDDFNTCYTKSADDRELLRLQFHAGYCFYFAHMLQLAFERGTVCWAAPFGHFVWCDTDGTPYDVESVYYGEAEYFIPEEYLGKAIDDFRHVDGKTYNATEEDIQRIIDSYKKDILAKKVVKDFLGGERISEEDVKAVGFDLEDSLMAAFRDHDVYEEYLRTPDMVYGRMRGFDTEYGYTWNELDENGVPIVASAKRKSDVARIIRRRHLAAEDAAVEAYADAYGL